MNVYLNTKPTRWKEGAKNPYQGMDVAARRKRHTVHRISLEGGYVDFEDKKTADDGVWVPVKNGAVIQMRFDNPCGIIRAKQLIFTDVTDGATTLRHRGCHALMDVMPNRTMARRCFQQSLHITRLSV